MVSIKLNRITHDRRRISYLVGGVSVINSDRLVKTVEKYSQYSARSHTLSDLKRHILAKKALVKNLTKKIYEYSAHREVLRILEEHYSKESSLRHALINDLTRGCDEGSVIDILILASLCKRTNRIEKAIEYYRVAIEKGNRLAKRKLEYLLCFTEKDLPGRDITKAEKVAEVLFGIKDFCSHRSRLYLHNIFSVWIPFFSRYLPKSLNIREIKVDKNGMRIIHCLPQNIRSLDLSSNGLGDEEVKTLAGYLPKHLISLDLHDNKIGDEGAKAVAQGLHEGLSSLDLSGNKIGDDGAKAIAHKLPAKLLSLRLSGNSIHYEGGKAIACCLPKTLQVLDLNDNLMKSVMSFFAENLPPTLTSLHLSGVFVSYTNGIEVLAKRIPLTLQSLDISDNLIRDVALKEFIYNLPPIITSLNLRKTGMGDDGAKTLARSFSRLRKLAMLNLMENFIGDDGAKALCQQLPDTLTLLNIYDNDISSDVKKLFIKKCANRITLHMRIDPTF